MGRKSRHHRAARRRPRGARPGRIPLRLEGLEPRVLLAGTLYISEFMALNDSILADEDGDYSDWIEIHNPGTATVSLNGWYLTDRAANLTKWKFPSVEIRPEGYLVVFASSKNRATPGGELHTNFSLSGDGEYLALVRPDGTTVESAYAPAFPPQFDDLSYGIGQDASVATLVSSDAACTVWIPTSDALGLSWTAPGFDDSAWLDGTGGVGYEKFVPGFAVRTYKANISVGNLATAEAVLANPAQQAWVASENAPVINYFNTGGTGRYSAANYPFPGTFINQDVEDYVVRATAQVTIPAAGLWTFGVNSDDGFRLTIAGAATTQVVNSNTPAGGDTISYANPRGPGDTLGTFSFAAAGTYALELVFYERGGGSGLELFAAPGARTAWDATNFDLVGDTANGGLAVESDAVGSASGSRYTGLIGTDVRTAMYNVNASAYIRLPFEVSDPLQYDSLTLRVNYDDGFVAYLNGVEVARRNAPAFLHWNSTATGTHENAQALAVEAIDLSGYLGLLRAGQNVLAIQGLNASQTSQKFLVAAELVDIDILGLTEHYFAVPTPGGVNSTSYYARVGDIQFSHEHGFYGTPFSVTLSTATAGAQIRYTTDGSTPTATTGTVYSAPISITGTTVLRAAAFKAGHDPAPVATRTYLFLADVLAQSPTGAPPAGWPTGPINGQILDYGMDPDIVNSPVWGPQLQAALTAIPSISLVTDVANLFNPSTGIYVNAGQDGAAWERPVSAELINPDGSLGFQINAGLRIRGGYSRSGGNPKHAFRLFFREEYGAAKLQFPLFGDEGVDEFDCIDLRTAQNYSWSFGGDPNNNFIAEVFSRDTQREMGQPYTRSRFYHLYVNGQYWGLYQTQERSEASFGESYLGGDAEDYDTIKVDDGYVVGATDGALAAWQDLWNQAAAGFSTLAAYYRAQGLNPDGTRNPAYPVLLDVDNLIDYMIVILYGGNLDAPISAFLGNASPNNWYGIRDRTGERGFAFFAHDAEHTLLNVNENRNGPWPAGDAFNKSNPQWIHQQLMYNEEYRLRFADRVHQYFFNDGLLTPAKATQRFLARAAEIEMAIIAESARWGDSKVATPLTKTNWQNAVNNVVNNYLPYRSNILLNQFRATVLRDGSSAPLYPSVVAPAFNLHGGEVVAAFSLTMSAPAGAIYYTTDGSDPRLVGGGVSPSAALYTGPIALAESVHVQARVLAGGTWSALNQATFVVSGQPNVQITEIMYHPSSGLDTQEYVEIHNASSGAVSTRGWRLAGAVDFALPERVIPAGGYLVVAANAAAFAAMYPTVTNYVAGWQGSLSDASETIELLDAAGNLLDRVTYADDGDWAARTSGPLDHGHQGWVWAAAHDGGGSSLELISLVLPDRYGQNWAASLVAQGTPGAANSVASTDAAPLILDLTHLPIIPRSTEPVTITARLLDEAGTGLTASLWYRLDGQPSFASLPMADDGDHGDGKAGDGVFGAILPAQPNGTVVEFYVAASDATGHTRTWPAPVQPSGTQAANLLYQVDDSFDPAAPWVPGSQPIYRLILTEAERAELAQIGAASDGQELSNALMNGTFIALDGTGLGVRYLVGVGNTGHETRTGPPSNYLVAFSSETLWRGAAAVVINSRYTHAQSLANAVYQAAGLAAPDSQAVQLRINGADLALPGSPMYGRYMSLEALGAAFALNHFPADPLGNLYAAFRTDDLAQEADLRYEGASAAAYQDTYFKLTNRDANDWSDLVTMLNVLNNAPAASFLAQVSQVINVEQWVRYLALDTLMMNYGPGLNRGIGNNYYLYRGVADPRFVLIPHDLDAVLGQGQASGDIAHSIFAFTGADGLNRLLTHPDVLPLYYSAILDLIATVFNPQAMNPLIDQTIGAFAPLAVTDAMKQFVVDRTAAVLAQIPREFAITSPLPVVNGYPRTTAATASLSGTADAAHTRSVLVNGNAGSWDPRTGQWTDSLPTGAQAQVLLSRGSVWRYLDNGSDQGTAWYQSGFNDSGWASGRAHLGYGDGDEATVVSYGPDPNNKYPTTYFRTTFNVANPSQVTALTLWLVRDDGAAVYLNGQEVVRNGLPVGAAFNTYATITVGGADESTFYQFTINPALLLSGLNTLAVEVHQSSPNSSDLSFDLELEATVPVGGTSIALQPGLNRVLVETFDGPNGTGNRLTSGTIDIWRDIPGTPIAGGHITTDTVLAPAAGPYTVAGHVIVDPGVTLTIQPGTTLFFETGARLTIEGRLVAEGTAAAPIRFTSVPGGGPWNGIQVSNTLADNRISHAILEWGVSDDGMVGMDNSRLTLDHVTFDHANRRRIRSVASSLTVRNCTFSDVYGEGETPATDGLSGHIWLAGPAPGPVVIQGNTFGLLKGPNHAIDLNGTGVSPVAILDNVFLGGGAHALRLDGDAHVEGNSFAGFHKDGSNPDPGYASALAVRGAHSYVAVRNTFSNVDHAALVYDEAFLVFANNTVAGAGHAALTFDLPGQTASPGRGAYVDGVIFADSPVAFDHVLVTTDLTINRSIIPAAWHSFGVGNVDEDPRLAASGFALLPGSPALGAGPNGLDMGALVPAGASLSGEPPAVTPLASATLTVAGPGITHYRYQVNGGGYGPETPVATPITLSGLANGAYTVQAVGRNSAGIWQAEADATASLTWTVNAGLSRVRINEVLASNRSAVEHEGTFPDLIELVNDGAVPADLSGMTLSDDPANPAKFVFAAGTTLLPGGFLVLYADGAATSGIHLGFSLDAQGEGVFLFASAAQGGALLDSVEYGLQVPDFSIGRVGHDSAWALTQPTFGAANVPQRTGDPATLRLNEWFTDGDVLFQDDFVELYNPDPLPVALGGLFLTDRPGPEPAKHAIAPLSFVAGGGFAVFIADDNEAAGPSHLGFKLSPHYEWLGLFDAAGNPIDTVLHLAQTTDMSQGRRPDGAAWPFAFFAIPTPALSNSSPVPVNIEGLMASLRITEVMYNPPDGADHEFIELQNTGATLLNLEGVRLGGGVSFVFPSLELAPGAFIVVVSDLEAFQSHYDVGVPVAGEFAGDLDNAGEGLTLRLPAPYDAAILDFRYSDGWYPTTDGQGHSLVVRDASAPRAAWDDAATWRPSLFDDGSPGAPDSGFAAGQIAINEIHYAPDVATDLLEFVEIHSGEATDTDVGGWSLSDAIAYTFPAGTTLPAGGYLVVAQDPAAFQARFGFTPLGPFTGRLSNGGERIVLRNALGQKVDAVGYGAGFPWPVVGEAPGPSIELLNPALDNRLGASWRPSLISGPTPGALNSVYATSFTPFVHTVSHSPREPLPGTPVVITAIVTDADGIAGVALEYQLVDPGSYISLADPLYATSWSSLAMHDDGLGVDEVAGDGIYSAELPAALQTHRRLVRYRVTAEDTVGTSTQAPHPEDPQPNFAYFVYGGVPGWSGAIEPGSSDPDRAAARPYDGAAMASVPVYHLLTKKADAEAAQWLDGYSGDAYPWLGTLVYNGVVYDHIRYQAGGDAWRYAAGKNAWTFDFNRSHPFEAEGNCENDYQEPWDKLDLSPCLLPADTGLRGEHGLFEAVAFRLFQLAGVPASHTHWATLRVIDEVAEAGATQYQGDFWGLYLAIERPDGRFLDEHGLPDGNLYRMDAWEGVLANQGYRAATDGSDLDAFLATAAANPSEAWWRANLDLQEYLSYRAILEATRSYDVGDGSNYLYYLDPTTGLWSVVPGDLRFTWAGTMPGNGAEPLAAPVLSWPALALDYQNRLREIRDLLFNTDQAYQVIDELAGFITGIVGADRAMWDFNPVLLSPYVDPAKAGQGEFYQASASGGFDGMAALLKSYVTARIGWMDTHLLSDPLIPATPAVTSLAPPEFPSNALSFRASAFGGSAPFAAMEWRLGEVTDPDNRSYDPDAPRRYEIEAVWTSGVLPAYASDITVPSSAVEAGHTYRIRVRMQDATGRWSHWSEAVEFEVSRPFDPLADALRITEVMYHPKDPVAPSQCRDNDFEFIEVKNIGPAPIDLLGFRLDKAVAFTFPQIILAPGAHVVVVSNLAAFASRYDTAGILVAGQYAGSLSNAGEEIQLRGPFGERIADFDYRDSWHPLTDGEGFSLVPVDEAGDLANWDRRSGWRTSAFVHGSPGADDPGYPAGTVVINELLSHTDLAAGDWIELHNTTSSPIDLGGWYLSDDAADLTKYRIQPGTVLPAGGFLVLNQRDHFGNAAAPGARVAFAFSEFGENAFLSSPDPSGQAGGYREGVAFGAADHEVPFGRYVTSTGRVDFVAVSAPTPGAANASPLVGPVVINEIMYHPPTAGGHEFIELRNTSSVAVPLYDLANPDNTWKFVDAIEFRFPAYTTLPANGYMLVVGIDPATFRAAYGVPAEVAIVGPYAGALANEGESVKLYRPGAPEGNGYVPYILVERVDYDDRQPWPEEPDGDGPALARWSGTLYGNDPAAWGASGPGGTPGRANGFLDATPPTPPVGPSAAAVSSSRIDLAWGASSDPETGVALYRIYRDGIAHQTTALTSFSDTGLAEDRTYAYQIAAVNGDGREGPLTAVLLATPKPSLQAAAAFDATHVAVTFGKPVQQASAESLGNYVLTDPVAQSVAILGAELQADRRTVNLVLAAPLSEGVLYTLRVSNVADGSGNVVAPNSQQSFVYTAWQSQDIGAVAAAGSTQLLGGVFTVQASGAGTGGYGDEFRFVFKPFSGDGEIVARIASLANADPAAAAGLMFRSSLAANASYVFAAVTAGAGSAFQCRSATADAAEHDSGTGAAPQWLRLVRSGNTFRSFVSADGVAWTLLAEDTAAMGTVAYVGLAITSHNDGVLATAVVDSMSVTPHEPPTISLTGPASDVSVNHNQAVTFTWTDADADSDAVIDLAIDPDDGSEPWGDEDHTWIAQGLSENPDGANDQFVWQPGATPPGTYTVWARINDGDHAPAYSRAVGRVSVLPDAPPTLTTVAPLPGAIEDTDFAVSYATLLGASNASDPDGDPLSFRIEAVTSGTLLKGGTPVVLGATLLSAGESLTWHPAADATGTLAAFTVRAWDGQAASAAPVQVNIQVAPVNDAPMANAQSVGTAEDTALAIALTGSGGDPEVAQTLTFGIVSGPSHGSLSGFNPGTGAVTYTPAPDYHGADSFTFTVTDDGLAGSPASLVSAPASVTITVTPANDAPVFGPSVPADMTVLLVGQAFSFPFSASDSDLDPLSYTLVSGPSWLSMDAVTGVLSGTPNRRAHLATDTVIVRVDDGHGGTDERTFQLTVQGQVIALGSGLPAPATKATFTDASGDLVSVGAKGLGTFYLLRGVAPDAGGLYGNATPGDLVAVEAEGTNSKSAIAFKVSSPVKAPLPGTSVGDIAVAGSLGVFGGAQVRLLGGLSVTGGVAKLTLGDVTAPSGLTMGADPLIASASVVLGRVQDAGLTSGTPLKSLALSEWLDTDATPDALIAPWISSLTTKRSKTLGGPVGDFQASVTLSGAGATKGTLGKVSIAGSVRGGTWDVTGAAGSVAIGGNFINGTFRAAVLKSLTVAGTILEDASDGDTDVIHVLTGIFTAGDLTWRGSIPPDHWFGGLRAFVG